MATEILFEKVKNAIKELNEKINEAREAEDKEEAYDEKKNVLLVSILALFKKPKTSYEIYAIDKDKNDKLTVSYQDLHNFGEQLNAASSKFLKLKDIDLIEYATNKSQDKSKPDEIILFNEGENHDETKKIEDSSDATNTTVQELLNIITMIVKELYTDVDKEKLNEIITNHGNGITMDQLETLNEQDQNNNAPDAVHRDSATDTAGWGPGAKILLAVGVVAVGGAAYAFSGSDEDGLFEYDNNLDLADL